MEGVASSSADITDLSKEREMKDQENLGTKPSSNQAGGANILGWEHLKLKGAIELADIALDREVLHEWPARSFMLRESIEATKTALFGKERCSYFERSLRPSVKLSLETAETLLEKLELQLRLSIRLLQ